MLLVYFIYGYLTMAVFTCGIAYFYFSRKRSPIPAVSALLVGLTWPLGLGFCIWAHIGLDAYIKNRIDSKKRE